MTPTKAQWKVFELCHKDHRGMSVAKAAKEMGVTPEYVKWMLHCLKVRYPELFTDINGDRRCPGGLFTDNKHRYTGKPKIVRYGPDVDRHIRQKF